MFERTEDMLVSNIECQKDSLNFVQYYDICFNYCGLKCQFLVQSAYIFQFQKDEECYLYAFQKQLKC